MEEERERVKNRLREAISLLCKSGLRFQHELNIEGLIGVTVDRDDVFLVSIREILCCDDVVEKSGKEKQDQRDQGITDEVKPLHIEPERTKHHRLSNNSVNNFEVYADEPEEIEAEDAWSAPASRTSPQSDNGLPSPQNHTPKPKDNVTNHNGSKHSPQVSENLPRKRSLSPTSCKSPSPKSPAILKQPPNIYSKTPLKPAHSQQLFPNMPINRSGSFDSLWTHHNQNDSSFSKRLNNMASMSDELRNNYFDMAFGFKRKFPSDTEDLPKAEDLSRKPSQENSMNNTEKDHLNSIKQERCESDNEDSMVSESEDTNMSGGSDALASSQTAMMNLATMGLPTFVPMSLAQLHQGNPSLSALQAALGSPPLNSSMGGLGLSHLSSQPQQQQQQASPFRTSQQQLQHFGCGSSGAETVCSNCATNKTTVWRRNAEGHLVCNACGLYYKLHQLRSPASSSSSSVSSRTDWSCSNCGTSITTMWRRNAEGFPVCNPCGLYYKLHQVNRPLTLVKPRIHSRRRKPKSYFYEAGGQGGSEDTRSENSKPKGNLSGQRKSDEDGSLDDVPMPRTSASVETPPSMPAFPSSMPAFPDRE